MKVSSGASRLSQRLRRLVAFAGAVALCGALALALAGCAAGSAGDAAAAGDAGGAASASGDGGSSASAPISVYSREDGSGTRGAFVELFGIEQKDANGDKMDIDLFFDLLDSKLQLVTGQLDERFEIQARKHVYNAPFLMGQGVWIDSEKLSPTDVQRDVLKHGTLTTGFIGLAECLVALTGQHHGQSPEAQRLGLEIVGHMRSYCDRVSQERGMNYSLIATPAEGLSGRFVRIDRERYGVIPGVTDRDYYTNGFHVPVYYDISAYDKIALEAPYHALTNGGHISYIELDGDPSDNLEAFESVIRYMKDCGMGYGSVNHPVDRDPVCGYNGIIEDVCPKCGRSEDAHNQPFERIRRITGYLVGTLDRFNDAKRAEESQRVKHEVPAGE